MHTYKGKIRIQGRMEKQSDRETSRILADYGYKQKMETIRLLKLLGPDTPEALIRKAAELGITPLDIE